MACARCDRVERVLRELLQLIDDAEQDDGCNVPPNEAWNDDMLRRLRAIQRRAGKVLLS